MNEHQRDRGLYRLGRMLAVAGIFLMLAWVGPPAVHRLLRRCPVRPDGTAEAGAVPSFARQTGMSCSMCHTVFPQLTPYGRRFKLNGYTLTSRAPDVAEYAVVADTAAAKRDLALSAISALSVVVQASYANYDRAPIINANPATGAPASHYQIDQPAIPAEIGLFYAGRVSDDIGTILQLDYDSTNSDSAVKLGPSEFVRWSGHTPERGVVYGATLTNTPGDADLYDTSFHGTPLILFDGAGLAGRNDGASTAGDGAGTHLNAPHGIQFPATGAVGTEVYAMIADSVYVQYGAFQSEGNGLLGGAASAGQLSGTASSARIAYEADWDRNSLMLGVYGSHADALPYYVPGLGGANIVNDQDPTVGYLDGAVDWEYEYISDEHIASFSGSVVQERQSNDPAYVAASGGGSASLLDAYSNRTDYLTQTQLLASYYYRRRYGVLTGWVNTTGTHDKLLHGANGSPDNQYWQIQLDYLPWLNAKIFLEYDIFTKVNGNQSPFYLADGASGINGKPSDNNMIELGLWMDF